MLEATGNNITMTEGDYGIALPITITGPTFSDYDTVKMTIKDPISGNTILEKEFDNIQQNTVSFELSSAESAKLPSGTFVYCLDWYQRGHFMCNLIPAARFVVGDKA